ncbi:choice-of-anchor M domain-containing protein [Corynebacterium hadale]
MRPMSLRRIAAALLACAVVPAAAPAVCTSAATAANAADLSETGHVPGDVGFGVDLPADTPWAGHDGKTHPCAGRKLLYHSHNDALYGTRIGRDLTVMAVDGQQVVDQDEVCFRLPRDADPDGNEVSRIQIPDDGSLDFLGQPGDTVWLAPQSVDWADNWRPIWSGLGAFDPAHEGDPSAIPSNFEDDLMHFDLTDIEGPGDVQIFFKNAISPAEIVFNSADPQARTVDYEVGAHGHFNWAFSKPGIYALTWQGRASLIDGTSQHTEPITQYWLVGDDGDVGLADGTTTELRKVTNYVGGDPGPGIEDGGAGADGGTDVSAPLTTAQLLPEEGEPSREPSGEPSKEPDDDSAPGGGAVTSTSEQPSATRPDEGRCEAARALRTKPEALISAGHMDMGLVDDGGIEAKLIDDSDPRSPTPRDSGTFLFEVPDAARTQIPANFRASFPGEPESMWVLPQAQVKGLPWLGFSTTRLTQDSLAPGSNVKVTMKDAEGPGRIFSWHESLGGTTLELDSGDAATALEYGVNDHDHQAFGFTKDGLYSATFRFEGTASSGEAFSKELTAAFAVGDSAVAQAKEYSSSGYASLDGTDCADSSDEPGADSGTGGSDTWVGALAKGIRSVDKEFGAFGEKAGPFFAHLRGGGKDAVATTSPKTPTSQLASPQPTSPKPPAPAQSAPSRRGSGAAAPTREQRVSASAGGSGSERPGSAPGSRGGARTHAPAKTSSAQGKSVPKKQTTTKQTTTTAKPDHGSDEKAGSGTGGIVSSFDGTKPKRGSDSDGDNGEDAAQAQVATSQGMTASGFWGGLILGVGLMALLGGIVLFTAAAKMLRDAPKPGSSSTDAAESSGV